MQIEVAPTHDARDPREEVARVVGTLEQGPAVERPVLDVEAGSADVDASGSRHHVVPG